jgi:RNA polymerase sigma-70 factor (ECF subfamily)
MDSPAVSYITTTTHERHRVLIERMAQRDAEALTELYDHYSHRLMGLLIGILGSPEDAEETLQEVFVELWRRAADYDPQRMTPRGWICMVTRCRGIDALRRRRPDAGAGTSQEDYALSPVEEAPDHLVSLGRRRALVRSAIALLGAHERAVIELAYFGGLSHREIAAQLRLPLGTVKSRTIRAMRRLKETLTLATGE